METYAEEASKAVKSAERKLRHALNQKEPNYVGLEPLLEKCRVSCGNLALLQFHLNQPADKTEAQLWQSHVQVKNKFSAWLRTFQEGNGKRKHVEKRKAEKFFVDFIKASQRFYRAYIGRLPANFSNIPKVLEIAQRLNQETLTVQELTPASEVQRVILVDSCKRNIIRLGDLARWRETESQAREKNWGPAKGYYNLALSLDPAEGACFNQHAAIAFTVEDHLGALYYLHRAATVSKPHILAPGNIGKEFDRLLALRNEQSYGLVEASGEDIVETLEKRFLAFHAHCYTHPYDFVAFQQKASDILHMTALCFQETSHGALDRFLQKACLINIAAEAVAHNGMYPASQSDPVKTPKDEKQVADIDRSCQSYFLLQRFNLMTFQSLLRVLARELGDVPVEGVDVTDLSRLSSVVRRVLPHLRQYSSWFLSNMRRLVETKYKSSRVFLEQVAKTYAATLNTLRANIDVFAPTSIKHLLEEDERTLSFSPFSTKVCEWRYYTPSTQQLKPVRIDTGNGKDLQEELAETQLRALDLVVDALRLVTKMDELGLSVIPLALDNGQFVQKDIPQAELPPPPASPPKQLWRRSHHPNSSSLNDIPDSPSRPLSRQAPVSPVRAVDVEKRESTPKRNKRNSARRSQQVESTAPTPIIPVQSVPIQTASEEATQTSLNSSSILVGTPAAPVAPAASAVPASGTLTAMDLVRQMQRSSAISPTAPRSPESGKKYSQPGLPSVYKTPFAPTASEQAQLSPQLEHAQKRSPSFTVPEVSSSAIFQEQLARQQREIQARSSPQPAFGPPSSWTTYGPTPTGMDSMFRAFDHKADRTPSPFANQGQSGNSRGTGGKAGAPTSPFGVIGQARPPSQSASPHGHG